VTVSPLECAAVAGGRVFILGAGFSKAISQSMPVMWELGREVQKEVGKERPLPRQLESFGDDLEATLSYLADNQPWLDDSSNLRNRALFGDVSRAIAEILGAAQRHTVQQPEPLWLRPLIDYWVQTSATVITFNYDVLIEAATSTLLGPHDSWSALYRAPLVPAAQRIGAVLGAEPSSRAFSLLKLHGSLTWFWSGIDSAPSDQIYDMGLKRGWSLEGLDSMYESNRHILVGDKQPMVVPPAATKSRFYDNAVLSSQWKLAAQALGLAQELIVIGYSLPKSDLVTRSLLLTNFAGNHIVAIDRSEAVVENLKELWASPRSINTNYVGSDDAVGKFVQAECQ
jgi:hypothetical protein